MKKIPKFLIATITPVFLLSPTISVNAAIKYKDTTWWSVEELLEFYQEVEAEKDAECGSDEECRMEFGFSMYERGLKYGALDSLMQGQIWVTSVNPAAETIKVLFFDEDMMLKHMGITEHLTLEHLYMGWFDDWKGQIFNYNHDQFVSGEVTGGVHTLYDSEVENLADIIPWQETEISVQGGELYNNTSGIIDYAAFADFFNAQGTFNYSACLVADDYEPGMECKMYVSGDLGFSFFPPRERIANDEQTENDDEQITDESEQTGNEEQSGENEQSDKDEQIGNDEQVDDNEQINEQPEYENNHLETNENEQTTTDGPELSDSTPDGIQTSTPEDQIPEIYTPENKTESIVENQGKGQETTPFVVLPEPVLETTAEETLFITTQPTLIPSAPDTGEHVVTEQGNTENFPVPLIIASLLLTAWWLMPTRCAKTKKKYEKSAKKLLTKKASCDKMVSV